MKGNRMYIRFATRIGILIILSPILSIIHSTIAQSHSGGLLLREAAAGLEIVTVDETGAVISVVQALPDYSFAPAPNTSWTLHPDFYIPTRQDITLSPDGTQLAFVAIQNETLFQLVIYQQDTDTLIEESLPGYAYPVWSPNGEELLLEMAYVPSGTTLPESTVYTPSLSTFRPLTSDSVSIENGFQWLDDNKIIYDKNRDIFLTDRLGSFHQQLTQIKQQILPEIAPIICEIAWSPVAQRVYFTVGCTDNEGYLYSVDLNGNVRFELSLIELYPDGYMPFLPMYIVDIFPSASSTDVLLLLDVATINPNDSSTDITLSIHRLTAPQTTELVFERRYPAPDAIGITTAKISPDRTFLALAGGNQTAANSYVLIVVNLTNGTVAFEQGGYQGICDLDWLSTTVLAYEVIPRLNCYADRFATNVQSVDVIVGSVNNISLSASVVGVPQPNITAPIMACAATIPAADTAALIAAITDANDAKSPSTLCLTEGIYTLNDAPIITGDITLLGNGATIEIASGGGFDVSERGSLALRDVLVVGAKSE